jgi:predicted NAD-dependent protein-ADP-ribosyltransferase YbiA (DUF1768 family)
VDGRNYPTVEHAFQASKTSNPEEQEEIRLAVTPTIAKRLGRKVRLRPNWEVEKLDVMEALLKIKFRDPQLAGKLKDTGTAFLVEGNYWGEISSGESATDEAEIIWEDF